MASITPIINTEIFVKEIRALWPNDCIYMHEIDQKIQELINDSRFQFPQIAGRLKDLSVTIHRILKPQPNKEITKLDNEGIVNKLDIIAKLAQGVSILDNDIQIYSSVPWIEFPFPLSSINRWINENSRLACAHCEKDILGENCEIPLLALPELSTAALEHSTEKEAVEMYDHFLRAGNSPNILTRRKDVYFTVLTGYIARFNHYIFATEGMVTFEKKPRISAEQRFQNLKAIIDLYLQHGADINLQPWKQLRKFCPTSFVVAQRLPNNNPYTIQILQYLIEHAQLDVNMTYISDDGTEMSMLNTAVTSQNPFSEMIETLIYYGAKFSPKNSAVGSHQSAAGNTAAANTATVEPQKKGIPDKLSHIIDRAFALHQDTTTMQCTFRDIILPNDILETTNLVIKDLVTLIMSYYFQYSKEIEIAQACLKKKEEFNKKYDSNFLQSIDKSMQ